MFERILPLVFLTILLLSSCQKKSYDKDYKEIYRRYIDNIICNEGTKESTPSGVFSGENVVYSCNGTTKKRVGDVLKEFDSLDKSYILQEIPDHDTSVRRKIYKFSEGKVLWMYTNKDRVVLLGIWHLSDQDQ